MLKAALVLALLASPPVATADSPSSWSQCILQNMKGVGSDMAARAIAAACAKQFPPKKEAQLPAKKEPAAADAQPPTADPSGQWTDFKPDPPK